MQVLRDCVAHRSSAATLSGLSGCHQPVGDEGGRGARPAASGSSMHWLSQLGGQLAPYTLLGLWCCELWVYECKPAQVWLVSLAPACH